MKKICFICLVVIATMILSSCDSFITSRDRCDYQCYYYLLNFTGKSITVEANHTTDDVISKNYFNLLTCLRWKNQSHTREDDDLANLDIFITMDGVKHLVDSEDGNGCQNPMIYRAATEDEFAKLAKHTKKMQTDVFVYELTEEYIKNLPVVE